MPIYAYKCDNCGVAFEKFQKFSDQPLKRCPECGKSTVKRVLQPAAVVFKGSGWYATDHRSPSGQGTTKSDSSGSSDKGESKPEKKEKESKAHTHPHPHTHDD